MNGTLPRRVTPRRIKVRNYVHFDAPLTQDALEKFTRTPEQITSHSFLPLLGYQKSTRKIDFSVFPPIPKIKRRDIRFASHTDSAIYSKYADILGKSYEAYLEQVSLTRAVLAYRGGIGYNVPFAKGLIEEIKNRGKCVVICLDISGFFDHISHGILKKNICKVLDENRLPLDWFKIFTRLTKYEYVLREEIESKIGKAKRKRICDIDTFRRAVRPLIKRNFNDFGIPQGTPLSGLFANISMINFDYLLNEKVTSSGGSYRRYSDDIAIVLPSEEYESNVMLFAQNLIKQHGLEFNNDKTCRTKFDLSVKEQLYVGEILQYLGFTFDGSKILIRPQSIKNFYAKMKRNIRRYVTSAKKNRIPIADLRKRVLIGRFTHWGDNRNFVQYAYRAAKEMQAPEIKRQLRNHVAIFDRQWAKSILIYED